MSWDRGITLCGLQFSRLEIEALTRREVPHLSAKEPSKATQASCEVPGGARSPTTRHPWAQRLSEKHTMTWGAPPITLDVLGLETVELPAPLVEGSRNRCSVVLPDGLPISIKTTMITTVNV